MINLVFRSYLKQKFNLNAEDFGYMFAAPAIGSMTGAFYFVIMKMKDPIKNLLVGIPAVILSLLCVQYVTSPQLTAFVLIFCGFFSYLNIASITQSMHLETSDDFRGRLGSIITLGFGSIAPLMSFPIAIMTDNLGFEFTIQTTTGLYAILSIILAYLNYRKQPKDIITSQT